MIEPKSRHNFIPADFMPSKEQPGQQPAAKEITDPEEMLHHLRILNATLGGKEIIK